MPLTLYCLYHCQPHILMKLKSNRSDITIALALHHPPHPRSLRGGGGFFFFLDATYYSVRSRARGGIEIQTVRTMEGWRVVSLIVCSIEIYFSCGAMSRYQDLRFSPLITCSVFIDTDSNCFMFFLQPSCSTDFILTPKVTMIKNLVCAF